ncbi:MAG TPA: hypothetical protein ENN05_05750 [Deltaproteobacteria bacterium]|nr:hypothetical protein [Deltaproteobacteria bacterium]
MIKISDAIIKVLFLLIFAVSFAGNATAAQWVLSDPANVQITGIWTTYNTATDKTERFCTLYNGSILHHDGTIWETMATGAPSYLNAVWGTAVDDIFAVGYEGTIVHYNGTVWQNQSYATALHLNAVWGTSGSNVYAAGEGGIILHYNGTAWSVMTSGTNNSLNGVWGSSANDVFAVGDSGTIIHYDGDVWTAFDNKTPYHLNAVWGYAADSVFAVGQYGIMAMYNGNVWNVISSEVSFDVDLYSIWGASACNIFAAGRLSGDGIIYRFNESQWSSQTVPAGTKPLLGIHGTSMRDIFAVGGQAGGNATFLTYTLAIGEEYPEVCATSPADKALQVSPGSSIYALFSTEMDPGTITTSSFTLTTGNDTISGTVTYEAGGFAVFTPDTHLSYAKTYVATISTDVEDPFGYAMEEEKSWDFTTTIIVSGSDGKGCFISSARVE